MASRNSGGTAPSLDVVARSIDLTTALLNSAKSSSPLVKVVLEVGQWLGREKLSKHELQDCLLRAKGIAFPNDDAELLFEDIRKGIDSSRTFPFLPQSSGSLGFLMANDPDLCWLVSTVTCLFQFHNACDVSECVNNFLLANRQHFSVIDGDHYQPIKHPSTIHLRRVVDKLVSSIWFNVVNAGCMTMELPKELISICPTGHNLKGLQFGRVVNALQGDKPKIMIKSDHFLRNLALWLLLHFDGLLQFVVSGLVIYKRQLGGSQREIEVRIQFYCSKSVCNQEGSRFELFMDVAGSPQSLLTGNYVKPFQMPENPEVRRNFYELHHNHSSENRVHQQSLRVLVRCTAQHIMRWLLDITVLAPYEFTNLGFSVDLQGTKKGNPNKVGDLLAHSPTMLNERWGNLRMSKVVYAQAPLNNDIEGSEDSALDPANAPERHINEVLPYFPILADLVGEARPLCQCLGCSRTDRSPGMIVPGCLQHDILTECLALLAHGIADGFSVSDASGANNMSALSDGMLQILLDLVEHQGILWDVWFGVASSVYLGCVCPVLPIREWVRWSTASTIAAVQYGNLAIIASWLNLTQELKLEGCFRAIETRGRLSVVRNHPSDGQQQQYRDIGDNYAVVQTENTEDTSSLVSEIYRETLPSSATVKIPEDEDVVVTDWILIQAGDSEYRLLMRVRTANHSRIVDPADALIRLARGISRQKCTHTSSARSLVLETEREVVMYPFTQMLGQWINWNHCFRFMGHNSGRLLGHDDGTEKPREPAAILHITYGLDSCMKQNLAFALSVNENAIVLDGSACFPCLQEQAKQAQGPHPDLNRAPGEHYIINVQKRLKIQNLRHGLYGFGPDFVVEARESPIYSRIQGRVTYY